MDAIVKRGGGKLPIVEDQAYRDVTGLKENLILLGNRDSNQAIQKLYYLHFTLLDARYPGPEGSELRSLHDPFGDGGNVIFAGGSDQPSVQRAVDWLVQAIESAPATGGNLSFGYLQKIELGKGVKMPTSAKGAPLWEDSTGYLSGYFGWNLLSKNLALFYMTGDESFAKEFLRLAFPDEKIAKELSEFDDEAYDDPRDPLAKPYHYRDIMMMLYWDLAEEHPFFTPEIRQRVTEKFAEQFYYHLGGVYKIMDRKEPQEILPGRHTILEALSAYADILVHLSDRTQKNWSVQFASPAFLNLVATLTGNQAFVDMIRDTGQSTSEFRIGQSYWPAKSYPLNTFHNTSGKLTALRLDPAAMKPDSDFPPEKVIDLLSWRQQPDAFGDYLLLDIKYKTGRVPVHSFSLVTLRIDGTTLLRGYANQVDILREGIPFGKRSDYAEITRQLKLGDTLIIQARIGNLGGHQWQRTLLLRKNKFLLALDVITANEDSQISQIDLGWQQVYRTAMTKGNNGDYLLRPQASKEASTKDYTLGVSLPLESRIVAGQGTLGSDNHSAQFSLVKPFSKGENVWMVSAIRAGTPLDTPTAAQKGDTVALQLPHPAILKTLPDGGFFLVEENHIWGLDVKNIPGFLSADTPVTVDFNRQSGQLVIQNNSTSQAAKITDIPGRPTLTCAPGKTIDIKLSEAPLPPALASLFAEAPTLLSAEATARKTATKVEEKLPSLPQTWQFSGSEFIHKLVLIDNGGTPLLAAADGKKIHLLTLQGELKRTLIASDTVGVMHRWPKERLLIVGSKDEFVRAFDLEGNERWNYKTQMAEELVASQKFYWFKKTKPGVTALQTLALPEGREVRFVGGTSTVEILTAEGKLEKRFYQVVGVVDTLTPLPSQEGSPARMFCARSAGDWPTVFEVTYHGSAWSQRDMGRTMTTDKASVDLGSFGYSMVGRTTLSIQRLTPEAPLTLVGDFNGSHNRLMQWSLDGKPLQEINLGPGFMAEDTTNSNYGRSALRRVNVRDLTFIDPEGNGNLEIILATNRQYILGFDAKFAQTFTVRLDNTPITLQRIVREGKKPLIAVGESSERILLLDGQGQKIATTTIEGIPTAIINHGDVLLVGSSTGKIAVLTLP